MFGVATSVMKGKKPVTSLFLALAFVHPEDRPDIVVVLGIHGLNHQWLADFFGKECAAPISPAAFLLALKPLHALEDARRAFQRLTRWSGEAAW